MKHKNNYVFENGVLAYKKCTKCGELKGVDCFSRNRTTTTGLASQCKECFNKRKRDINNPEISFDALKTIYPQIVEKNAIRSGVTCKENCLKYPCYRDIDNCKLNLALTCIKFKKK